MPIRKRTPWTKLRPSSRARARKAGVTEQGYAAGAWVPWDKGPKPKTRYQISVQRSINRYGFTPAQLRGFPPNLRESLEDAVSSGANLRWLVDIPVPIRPQAYRYWRDEGKRPPEQDIRFFKRNVPGWKKPLVGKEANLYFAQAKPIPDTQGLYEDPHRLSDDAFRRRFWFGTVDANKQIIDKGDDSPAWFWWYH